MRHNHRGKSSESFLDKEIILRELNILPEQIILDAGCGNGYMSKAFSRLLNNTGKVYALDPDEERIEALLPQTEGTNIEAILGDISRTTPLDTSSIDLIYMSMVIHMFSEDEIQDVQKQIERLLKPHGRLAVVEIHKRISPFGPPLDMRFSPDDLKRVITLSPLSTIEVGEYFYMQLFANNTGDSI